jgi:hypothetical protein
MFFTKDHKTLDMFDPFEHLGPRRRKLLEGSWAHLFREKILPELPVQQLLVHYSEFNGRPTKELYAMLGLMILQQMHDLTDEDAIDQFTFNKKWHYALNVTGESDEEAYVCPRTLWSMRKILTEHDLYRPLFESVTAKLARVFDIDTGKQRIDSVHIRSNMRHLGRIGLFVATIKKFLRNIKRHHKGLYNSLPGELTDRYMTRRGESAFSMVKPSESSRTLETLANDLFYLVDRFREHSDVLDMTSYQLLVRLFKEQCLVEGGSQAGQRRVCVKPNKDVPSDSLQSPSDPDAGYSGHKGKGYQAQVAETYESSEEKKQPSLITHVSVEPANKSDARALIPFIEETKSRGLGPGEVLADTLYGGDENVETAACELNVEVVSPVKGPEPGKDKSVSLTDFTLSKRGKVTSCPEGHAPFRAKHKKERHSAAFDKEICSACPLVEDCPVKPGKGGYYLRYDDRAARSAGRRAYERTDAFRERYRFRAGVEATLSYFDRKTGVKQLRVRGIEAVTCAAFLKAAGVNILRAAAFKNRKNRGNGPSIPPFQPVPKLFNAVKELLSSTINDLGRMMTRSDFGYRSPAKTTT